MSDEKPGVLNEHRNEVAQLAKLTVRGEELAEFRRSLVKLRGVDEGGISRHAILGQVKSEVTEYLHSEKHNRIVRRQLGVFSLFVLLGPLAGAGE